jgi:hypothetical protein
MAGDPIVQPDQGGRLQAKLVASDLTSATYELSVSDPNTSFEGRAVIGEANGEVSFDAWQGNGAPSAWLVDGVRALLRSAWQRRRSGQSWPRRLTRWRPEPDRDA